MPSYRRPIRAAMALPGVPFHHRRAPLGNSLSRLEKNVPRPATRFTWRPGYAVISACAVSIAVFPPPMIHTGASLSLMSPARTSQ